jgi:hypothetical protein
MRRAIALVPLLGAILLGACATSGLIPPSQGGHRWLELSTAHFVVRTDLDEDVARGELMRLEALRAALLSAILPDIDLPTGQLPVVILRSGAEWKQVIRPGIAGIMVERVLFKPLILYSAAGVVQDMDLVKHELTHYISRLYLRNVPPWMDEGVALFFESTRVDAVRGLAIVGRPGRRNYAQVRDAIMPLAKVLSYIRAPEDQRFYATSWLLVHYLVYHEPDRFAEYRRLLQSPATAERAWDVAFAGLPLETLEAAVKAYVHNGQYAEIERPFRVLYPLPRLRTLDELEVRRVLALLHLASIGAGPDDAAAQRIAAIEIAEALKLDATDVEANALAVVARNETGLALAERAKAVVASHPDSWLAWTLAAMAAASDAERAEAVSKAMSLGASDPAISLGRLAGQP